MKVAFVHEYLNQFGGAERLLQVLCAMFPNAPIFTLLYDENATGGVFAGRDIRTSFLQKVPFAKKHHRLFPLLMPVAVEQFDFSDFDLVLSVSASFAKGIITKPGTKHICYCLTPPRFLWDESQQFIKSISYPAILKKIIPPFMTYLRIWDKEASFRVDQFWTISGFINERIEKYYGRKAEAIIYPPVNVAKFHIFAQTGDYFFMAGRLVSYKRFDLAIRAFNELKLPLKIAGDGPEADRLKKMAGKNVEFLGLVSDEKLAELYAGAKACIFPQEEDFGIVPLESMASGRPVIAYRGGGAVETIVEGKTGVFFKSQEVLKESLKKFDPNKFDPLICRANSQKFGKENFAGNFKQTVASLL